MLEAQWENVSQMARIHLAPVDKAQNPRKLDGDPVVTSDNPEVVGTFKVLDDGTLAVDIKSSDTFFGESVVNIVGDGDPLPGDAHRRDVTLQVHCVVTDAGVDALGGSVEVLPKQ